MENAISSSMASPPLAPSDRRNLTPFYYSVIAIASTAVFLVAYNLFVIGWCWQNYRNHRLGGSTVNQSGDLENPRQELIPVYKYQKDGTRTQASDNECSVCLSVFVDGEELRQLPGCKHSFHLACIDMWLSSHSSCPLCRAVVAVRRPQILTSTDYDEEVFRPGYPGSSAML